MSFFAQRWKEYKESWSNVSRSTIRKIWVAAALFIACGIANSVGVNKYVYLAMLIVTLIAIGAVLHSIFTKDWKPAKKE